MTQPADWNAQPQAGDDGEVAMILDAYRLKRWSFWRGCVNEPWSRELTSPRGCRYRLDAQATWADEPGGPIRVSLIVDDGRADAPFADGAQFVIAEDGSFLT